MYAVILTGGKQYKVSEGDIITVEKLDANVGDTVELEVLMVVDGETVKTTDNANAKAEVLAHGKDKKVVVFKYKPKKNIRKKQGHRQPFTRIKINTIA